MPRTPAEKMTESGAVAPTPNKSDSVTDAPLALVHKDDDYEPVFGPVQDERFGQRIRKSFGSRAFWGSVVDSYVVNRGLFYKVSFDDGDVDILSVQEVEQCLKHATAHATEDKDTETTRASPSSAHAENDGTDVESPRRACMDALRTKRATFKRRRDVELDADGHWNVRLWSTRLFATIVDTNGFITLHDFVRMDNNDAGELESTGLVQVGDALYAVGGRVVHGMMTYLKACELIRTLPRPITLTFFRPSAGGRSQHQQSTGVGSTQATTAAPATATGDPPSAKKSKPSELSTARVPSSPAVAVVQPQPTTAGSSTPSLSATKKTTTPSPSTTTTTSFTTPSAASASSASPSTSRSLAAAVSTRLSQLSRLPTARNGSMPQRPTQMQKPFVAPPTIQQLTNPPASTKPTLPAAQQQTAASTLNFHTWQHNTGTSHATPTDARASNHSSNMRFYVPPHQPRYQAPKMGMSRPQPAVGSTTDAYRHQTSTTNQASSRAMQPYVAAPSVNSYYQSQSAYAQQQSVVGYNQSSLWSHQARIWGQAHNFAQQQPQPEPAPGTPAMTLGEFIEQSVRRETAATTMMRERNASFAAQPYQQPTTHQRAPQPSVQASFPAYTASHAPSRIQERAPPVQRASSPVKIKPVPSMTPAPGGILDLTVELSDDDDDDDDDGATNSFLRPDQITLVEPVSSQAYSSSAAYTMPISSRPSYLAKYKEDEVIEVVVTHSRLFLTLSCSGEHVSVSTFVRGDSGEMGEIEASGRVFVGDIIVGVGAAPVLPFSKPHDVAMQVSRQPRPYTVYFIRPSWDML